MPSLNAPLLLSSGLALSLTLSCTSKIETTSSPGAADCTSPLSLDPIFVPQAAASQPAAWATQELVRSFVPPFQCAWEDRTNLQEGLKQLQKQLNEEIPLTSLSFYIRQEGQTEIDEITLEGRDLREAAEKGILNLFPALRLEKAVTQNSRKEQEPLGDDIPLSLDVIDYGLYSYLKLTEDSPPLRWPKDSTEPQKSTEIWNAKAQKWMKRTCY